MRVLRLTGRYWAAILVACVVAVNLGGGLFADLFDGFRLPRERYYDLPYANVEARIGDDGAVAVRESITFDFHGTYSGAYRDIPLAPGQAIDAVSVSEQGLEYSPGASTVLGSFGTPGSFGSTSIPGGTRIVWHYLAGDEARVFTIRYTVHGALTVYPDVVDVNMNAWGDGWPEPLGLLVASIRMPEGVRPLAAYATPPWIGGEVEIREPVVAMRASDVDSGQVAGLRVLLPPAAAAGMSDVRRDPARARESIRRSEQRALGAYDRERDRLDTARRLWPLTALLLLALATIPVALVILVIHLRYGRDSASGYDQRYEREPPSDDPPALVPSLVSQHADVGSREFTATMFDLILRDRLRTQPAEDASLAVAVSETDGSLEPYENRVVDIVRTLEAQNGGPVELERMGKVARGAPDETRRSLAKSYEGFASSAETALKKRGWIDASGSALRLALVVLLLAAAAGLFALWYSTRTPARPFRDAAELSVALCLVISALIAMATPRSVFNRRRHEAALLGARWDSFRRFLEDFPRFADAVPVQVEVWERLLVYGIAFGIADHILDEARLRLGEEVMTSGGAVFAGSWGGDGLGNSLGHSFAPPSSSSGGGGGGGGGGGFGGGGGGAW